MKRIEGYEKQENNTKKNIRRRQERKNKFRDKFGGGDEIKNK